MIGLKFRENAKTRAKEFTKDSYYYKWGTGEETIIRDNVVFVLEVSDF